MDNDQLKEENKLLKRQIGKLTLEANLKKRLDEQIEKQKQIIIESKTEALKKSEELTTLTEKLSKFLSPQLYDLVFSSEESAKLNSARKKLTIFFSDLVGFTNHTDNLESEEITSMLNFYLTEMSKISVEFGGTIDKYIGDAILVFFGDPNSRGVQEDAVKCVSMAIKMQERMHELRNYWIKEFSLKEPLKMRIGINTGFCTVGNFGSSNRLDYTVIGRAVNLASRLESISKPDEILISSDTYHQVKNHIKCKESSMISIKGLNEDVRTYKVDKKQNPLNKLLEHNSPNVHLTLNKKSLSEEEIKNLKKFIKKNV